VLIDFKRVLIFGSLFVRRPLLFFSCWPSQFYSERECNCFKFISSFLNWKFQYFFPDKPQTITNAKHQHQSAKFTQSSAAVEQNNQEIFNFLNDCFITNLAKQQQQQQQNQQSNARSSHSKKPPSDSHSTVNPSPQHRKGQQQEQRAPSPVKCKDKTKPVDHKQNSIE
jgi:hypothetical protein